MYSIARSAWHGRILVLLLLLVGCTHPVDITGMGSVLSLSGERNCMASQAPCETTAMADYQEVYKAVPATGHRFLGWQGCPEFGIQIIPQDNLCTFNISADTVEKHWFQTAPALVAEFSTHPYIGLIDYYRSPYSYPTQLLPGHAVLEPPSLSTYGSYVSDELAEFGSLTIAGELRIPVLMVDWEDFNPATDSHDLSRPDDSHMPNYKRHTRAQLGEFLNGPNGPASYYRQVSAGALNITFDVQPWVRSETSDYVDARQPFYLTALSEGRWAGDRRGLVTDVMRAAVADFGVDFRNYDADGNRFIDGLVLVHEGGSGTFPGTNLSSTRLWAQNNEGLQLGRLNFVFPNVARLVDDIDLGDDLVLDLFAKQDILFDRYLNIPEVQDGELTRLATWVHELGHLLLGFRDYYVGERPVGHFALSASGDMAAMEKYLFGHWLEPTTITQSGHYAVRDDRIGEGGHYSRQNDHLFKTHINGDPAHYLLIENHLAAVPDDGGSLVSHRAYSSEENGLVIWEVNQHKNTPDQITRHLPARVYELFQQLYENASVKRSPEELNHGYGAYQQGDVFELEHEGGRIRIENLSGEGSTVSFDVDLGSV